MSVLAIAVSVNISYVCLFALATKYPTLGTLAAFLAPKGQMIEGLAFFVGGIALCRQADLEFAGIAAGCFELFFGIISFAEPTANIWDIVLQAGFMIFGVFVQLEALRPNQPRSYVRS